MLHTLLYILILGQPLCATCRDETHRAKMFSQHEVIDMPSKKVKESSKMVSCFTFVVQTNDTFKDNFLLLFVTIQKFR